MGAPGGSGGAFQGFRRFASASVGNFQVLTAGSKQVPWRATACRRLVCSNFSLAIPPCC